MAHSTQARNDAVNGMGSNSTGPALFLSLHTADPTTTGASEVAGGSYVRKAITIPAASGGTTTSTQATIDVPAGTTVSHWGRWSAVSGGNFYQGGSLPANETFSAAGSYVLSIQISQAA